MPHSVPQLPHIKRCEPWFADGNLLLIAEDGACAFRVHAGVLGRHSPFFRALASIPQPPSEEDEGGTLNVLEDGCGVLRMLDSMQDLSCLLRGLYDGLYCSKPRAHHLPSLASILKLADKYAFDVLHTQTLLRFNQDWPSTLSKWDARESLATYPGELGQKYSPRKCYAHPLLVVRAARELGRRELLPSAFYDLSRYSPMAIASGMLRNRTTQRDIAEGMEGPEESMRPSLEDLLIILGGREASRRYFACFVAHALERRAPHPDCAFASTPTTDAVAPLMLPVLLDTEQPNPTADVLAVEPPLAIPPTGADERSDVPSKTPCARALANITCHMLRHLAGLPRGREADPLHVLAQVISMLTDPACEPTVELQSICNVCKASLILDMQAAREDIWICIPGWFGLGSWEEV